MIYEKPDETAVFCNSSFSVWQKVVKLVFYQGSALAVFLKKQEVSLLLFLLSGCVIPVIALPNTYQR